MICDFSQSDLVKIKKAGFNYDILFDDVVEFYKERNSNPEKYIQKSTTQVNCGQTIPSYQTPTNFTLGTIGGFYRYTELLAQLDSMRVRFPNLISIKQEISSTHTIENKPIYYVKISDNADVDENEPEVLYSALTHAREPMGMQQLVFFMWYLMENYDNDAEIHQLLDNTELYFVPCVNVDGYIYNETTNNNGGGLWRKNRRNSGSGNYGIDLNRNYGFEWGYDDNGSSPDPASETYRGTDGFSEPETQAMKSFCEQREFILAIDYHCYSNLLIYPWGYKENFFTPDSLLFKTYSELMVEENGYIYGTPNQTVNYTGNGSSFDWFYGEQTTKGKIISWSPEAGNTDDGFWPASNRIADIAKVNIAQNMYVARFAGKYAKAKDLTISTLNNLNGYLKFDLQRLGMASPASFTISIEPISANILSVGSPKVFSSLDILETVIDSIAYTLDPSIQTGQIIKYVLKLDNGAYFTTDTISKIYGQAAIVFTDNGNAISNWTAGGWGISTTQYHSAPSSITDSPNGNYAGGANKSITLNTAIDLTGAISANLSFWAKWNIEAGYDYAQVKASSNNGTTWTPLCGKYTKAGTANQLEGQQLYDGTQLTWVLEEIDLADYLGQSIKIRFTLKSDAFTNSDGFYFDDITVSKITNTTSIETNQLEENQIISNPIPNPANESVSFDYLLKEQNANTKFYIYNSLGQEVFTTKLINLSGRLQIDISQWQKGVYYYSVSINNNKTQNKKMIIL